MWHYVQCGVEICLSLSLNGGWWTSSFVLVKYFNSGINIFHCHTAYHATFVYNMLKHKSQFDSYVIHNTKLHLLDAVKHYFFRHILILRFPNVEISPHFNSADFPVNFIKQFFLFLLVPQTNVIIKIRPILLFTLYNKHIAYHITEELIFYADKITAMGNSKISRFYSNHENRENLMLVKYTRFTVACRHTLIACIGHTCWNWRHSRTSRC